MIADGIGIARTVPSWNHNCGVNENVRSRWIRLLVDDGVPSNAARVAGIVVGGVGRRLDDGISVIETVASKLRSRSGGDAIAVYNNLSGSLHCTKRTQHKAYSEGCE